MASLTVQQKQELAARLLELVPYGPEIRREDVPADLEHVFSKLRERVREVLVELYCAEFSDAELESQLNYYESPRCCETKYCKRTHRKHFDLSA